MKTHIEVNCLLGRAAVAHQLRVDSEARLVSEARRIFHSHCSPSVWTIPHHWTISSLLKRMLGIMTYQMATLTTLVVRKARES